MNEITEITPQIKDKRRCNVYIDGRFCCGLTLETAVKYRLKVGEVISPERLSEIQLESEKNVALDKALTHISASKKTEKQVRDFLSGKGYLPAVCDYVLEKMRGYGFVDDKDYAKDYVQFSASKKGGSIIRQNSPVGMLKNEYKYKFCGLPKGVSIPPKFAEIFCKINRYAICFSFFTVLSAK